MVLVEQQRTANVIAWQSALLDVRPGEFVSADALKQAKKLTRTIVEGLRL